MPRPHAPDDPLVVTRRLVDAARALTMRGAVALAPDRRAIVPIREDATWLDASLACPCGDADDACEHQLLAALALEHPLTLAPDPNGTLATLVASLGHDVRLRLQRLRHTPATLVGTTADLTRRLTDPATTDAEHIALARGDLDLLLAYAAGRRPGSVHDAAWGIIDRRLGTLRLVALLQHGLAGATERHGPSFARLLATTPDDALPRRLAPLVADPVARALLGAALTADAALAPRLARLLSTPLLATLLAALDAEPRERLVRAVHGHSPSRGRP